MSTQQQAQAGDNARIIQIIGDNNVVDGSPHLFITPLPPERPAPTEPARDEASLLRPVMEATAFVGREPLLTDFVAWANAHETQRPVSMRVVHGGAGVGKTRFARELCRALAPDWQTGFVTNAEARRTLARGNLGAWQWRKPTLIVFDYALSLTDTLRVWLEELCAATPRAHPLRILLLERQADAQSGWLERLLQSGFGLNEIMPRDLLDGPPRLLPGLSAPEVQRGIMQNMLDRLGSRVVLPADDADFQARLAATDWAGAPLYLMMAAMVMHQQGGVNEALHLGRVDLAYFLEDHECARLRLPCGLNAPLRTLVVHAAAFATLCGGIGALELRPFLAREREVLGCDSGNVAEALRLLSDLLPDGGEGVAPIQPDIVGEAFVLKHLADGRQTDGKQAVLRAFGDKPSAVAAALVRCVQDFAPRAGTDASDQARTAGQRAMAWLRALGDLPELPLETLLVLTGALPQYTTSLRGLAANWQSRVVEHLRQQQNGSIEKMVTLAASLHDFTYRLNSLELRHEVHKIAQEATDLYRKLNTHNPDAFRSGLAMSLNNLAYSLSDLGQRQEACKIAQEATDIYRELDALNPAAFRPDLAMSLNNLANWLCDLGLRQEACKIAQEAVDIRRKLAAGNPDAFRPNLAKSLNNLGTIFNELGQQREASKVVQEVVDIRRELAATNPDAFRPDLATSLNNLAIILSDLGQRQEPHEIAQEAVDIWRELAADNPDAYRHDLAMSLNNLATMLIAIGQRQEASNIAQEAVEFWRKLAASNSGAFRPNLAKSLYNLAIMLSELGQQQEAHRIGRESARIFHELSRQLPQAFEQMSTSALLKWLSFHHNISREEAFALLQQDPQAQIDALFNDDDADAPFPSDNPTPQ